MIVHHDDMAPSKESAYLTELFKSIVQNNPTDGNVFKQRVTYDSVMTASTEPTDVMYEDIVLPGPQRGPAKLVKPLNASKAHAIVFFHGGGYTMGSVESHRKMCGHLAKACNTLALMVDYRLSPEHPFPAAIDDCVAGYKWLIDQGFQGKSLITAGDSCGGGLATSVALKVIRDGLPAPGAVVALSPWYDAVGQDSESQRTNLENDVLQAEDTVDFLAGRYCTGDTDRRDPLISAIFASDEELSKLPPHWISCGGYDQLLDDGIRMAQRLQRAGVEAILKVGEEMQQ